MTSDYSLSIDRLSMTQRPPGQSGGEQSWRNLLFMHWVVPKEALSDLLPSGVELDLYQGQALIGLVPFEMYRVRPSWLPTWMSFDFLETNVRLYVTVNDRPGVYFLSLDAASWLAVRAARIGWGLPYFYSTMSNRGPDLSRALLEAPDYADYSGQEMSYYCRRRSWSAASPPAELSLEYRVEDELPDSTLGSLEFFLLERYLLFVSRGNKLFEGQVHHRPYPVFNASLISCTQNLISSHGLSCDVNPLYIHASPGVDVEVFDLRVI